MENKYSFFQILYFNFIYKLPSLVTDSMCGSNELCLLLYLIICLKIRVWPLIFLEGSAGKVP